jgi:hypothetical protein
MDLNTIAAICILSLIFIIFIIFILDYYCKKKTLDKTKNPSFPSLKCNIIQL